MENAAEHNDVVRKERIKAYKRRFDAKLKHIKIILMGNLKTMSSDEWNAFLLDTKDSILKNPSHFLGENLPSSEIIAEVINHVFNGFLEDLKVRKVQSFRDPSVYHNVRLIHKHS